MDVVLVDNKELTTLDLFCGIGGVKISFENNGFKCVQAIDYDKHCKETFDINSDIKLDLLDINDIHIEQYFRYLVNKIDVVCMGFNCQPFSIAGERKGFDDSRSESFISAIKIIDYIKPRCVFIENVKGLMTHDKGKSFKRVLNMLEEVNMKNIHYNVINTCEYSKLPQNRERVYIVAFCDPNIKFDMKLEKRKHKNWRDFLEEKEVSNKYEYTEESKIYNKLKDVCTSDKIIYQYRRTLVRENKSNVCPCLTSNMGTGGHNVPIILINEKIRKLTPRECFNLQGFPKDFKLPKISDSHLYKQIGNSVSIPIIEKIAKKIYNALIL